jgi:hypothetical protein
MQEDKPVKAVNIVTGQIYDPTVPVPDAPPPKFRTWEEFIQNTPATVILAWCNRKASRANRKRLLSAAPNVRITGDNVLAVLQNAKGRCRYCNSLCIENRPSGPNGAPIAWANVGRRIGSLGHIDSRIGGGDNDVSNLSWECLWCNTWASERRYGATDHGGIQLLEILKKR